MVRAFISAMNKILPLFAMTLIAISVPSIYGEPVIEIELSPEPSFNQVLAYETYLVNVSLNYLNISLIDLAEYTGEPDTILFEGKISVKGRGGYDFGESSTGYSFNLEDFSLNLSSPIDIGFTVFNYTFEKDAYEYGVKPYENVDIKLKFDGYLLMSDDSMGPKISTKSIDLILIDEMKIQYLEGKFSEMMEEIKVVIDKPGLESLNRDRYIEYLNEMNSTLTLGDYVEALDVWDDYDEKHRLDLIREVARASEIQYEELIQLESIEDQLETTIEEFEALESEYESLFETYAALANTYHKVNAELDVAKKNLSTAITAVFITAIIFYFLGQRELKRRIE